MMRIIDLTRQRNGYIKTKIVKLLDIGLRTLQIKVT
jgi:hypothetical protein